METKRESGYAEAVPSENMRSPFFSIIVPVYNVEQYLEKCVQSLLDQEDMEEDWEILLIDDGSTDQSGVLSDRMAARHEQIRVFHKENGGLSSARNFGIEQAKGTYILFVDSDDYVEKKMCSILKAALQKYGEADAVCFDGAEESGNAQNSMRRLPLEKERCTENGKVYLLEHYKERNLNVEACLYAYKRTFLDEKKLRFCEGRLHEDVEFTPRALLSCGKIIEVPDCLYHYMVRESSISTQKNKEKNIRDLFMTLQEQCETADLQEPELKKWTKNAVLDRYLNMVQYAGMYQPQYRNMINKRFLLGKAATNWNRFRVMLCMISVRLYCLVNDGYKMMKNLKRNE